MFWNMTLLYRVFVEQPSTFAAWRWTSSLVLWTLSLFEWIHHRGRSTVCWSDMGMFDAYQMHRMTQSFSHRHHTLCRWRAELVSQQGRLPWSTRGLKLRRITKNRKSRNGKQSMHAIMANATNKDIQFQFFLWHRRCHTIQNLFRE